MPPSDVCSAHEWPARRVLCQHAAPAGRIAKVVDALDPETGSERLMTIWQLLQWGRFKDSSYPCGSYACFDVASGEWIQRLRPVLGLACTHVLPKRD
eukprot:2246221-Prymnesium_polylepis.1